MLIAALAMFWLLVVTPSAHACEADEVPIPDTDGGGTVCVPASDPGDPGGTPDDHGPATDDPGGEAPACQSPGGGAIPCELDGAIWSASHACYAFQVDAPLGAPEWEGHTEGTLWKCLADFVRGLIPDAPIWWVSPGDEPAPPPPNPVVLAEQALDTLQLATAKVNTAPTPPHMTYVGLETWLWLDKAQWREMSKSVTAGRTTVTVTAEPDHVFWDTGDGSSVACGSPGVRWETWMVSTAQTDCSYTYSSTGTRAMSATIVYRVDWTCSGVCLRDGGTLGEVDGVTGSTNLRVGERQSVVTEID